MSWEGYEVVVCVGGHLSNRNADFYGSEDYWKCPVCGLPADSVGTVDETNGLPYFLNFKVVRLTPEEGRICPTCNSYKVIKEATYKMVRVPIYESEHGDYIEE